MTRQIFKITLILLVGIFFMSVIISCNANNKSQNKVSSDTASEKVVIPDTVVRFLITSASNDFQNHQPPTPIDFRNVKIGYIESSPNEITYILCGEFQSRENKQWIEFTTIKTSGYEQYIGKSQYCKDAKIVLTDKNLTIELKNKLNK